MNPNWFSTRKVHDGLYVTRELHFFEGNRANIWLVKGPTKDVIIDTGSITEAFSTEIYRLLVRKSTLSIQIRVLACISILMQHS